MLKGYNDVNDDNVNDNKKNNDSDIKGKGCYLIVVDALSPTLLLFQSVLFSLKLLDLKDFFSFSSNV